MSPDPSGDRRGLRRFRRRERRAARRTPRQSAYHPDPLQSRALAGLRVGFAIGQRPLIEALERVKNSFNSYPLDRLAIAGAVAAYEDDDWFEDTRRRIIMSRKRLATSLKDLGFEVLPSSANFLFARHPL